MPFNKKIDKEHDNNFSKYLIDNGGNLFNNNNNLLINCIAYENKELIEYFVKVNNININNYNIDNILNNPIEELSGYDLICGFLNGDILIKKEITINNINNNQ